MRKKPTAKRFLTIIYLYFSYEGRNCESCAPGFTGNPLIHGDSCRQKVEEQCNTAGTESTRLLGDCICKENVQGRYCDQCKNNSFFLSNDFR